MTAQEAKAYGIVDNVVESTRQIQTLAAVTPAA
jgi:ATP-dependent protease ClpP protease subunit